MCLQGVARLNSTKGLLSPPWGHSLQPTGFTLQNVFSWLHVHGRKTQTSTDMPQSFMDMGRWSYTCITYHNPTSVGPSQTVNRVQLSGASAPVGKSPCHFSNYAAQLDFLKLMGVALTLRT